MPDAIRRRSPVSAVGTCLAAGGITLLLLGVVYALRGIWPFGADNVAYVDTAQFYLPSYYALWDVLHGASPDINWFSGLAEGTAVSLWDYLDPANLVFLFVARDHVLEGLSLYLAVKLLFVALAAGAAVVIRFPRLSFPGQLVLTLTYTFSGYILQYYANFSWLGTAALFPLFLLALEYLLRDGKCLPYIVLLAYQIVLSVYFTYMVLMYTLLFAFAYAVFLLTKERRGDRLLRLGVSTAAAFSLTAYWWTWSAAALTGTSRFQSNMDTGLMAGFTTWDLTATRHTFLMLLGLGLAAALFLRALRRGARLTGTERDRRRNVFRFFGFLLGALAIPTIFTNIDTAWHFGQYNFFPMRYGFVLPATVLAAAGLCLEEEQNAAPVRPGPGRRRLILRAAGIAAAAAGLILLEPRLTAYFREYGACFLHTLGAQEYWGRYFPLLLGCAVLFTALYLLLLRLAHRRTAAWLIAGAVLLQLGTNAFGFLAPSDDHTHTKEYDPAYVETSDALRDAFAGQAPAWLSRVKNADNSLNAGYPVIAGVSALSSVNANNSAARLGFFRELGYTVNYFRLLDTGGTVFSDMLLGVDTALTAGPADDTLYSDTGTEIAGIHVSEANYPGIIGLQFPAGALDGYSDILTLTGRLDALHRAFTGSDDSIAYEPPIELSAEGEGLRTFTVACELPEASFLYLFTDAAAILNITADGRAIAVPSYQNTQNIVYPAAFNANLLYLGAFDPGTVRVTFLCASDLAAEDLRFTALRREAVETFRADAYYDENTSVEYRGDTILLTLEADHPGMELFLPLTWSARWICTVNGAPVEANRLPGRLMSLPLQEGRNEISLTPGPSRFEATPGFFLSLAALFVVLAAWLFTRRRPERAASLPAPLCAAARVLFGLVFAAAVLFVYAAPAALFLLRGSVVLF